MPRKNDASIAPKFFSKTRRRARELAVQLLYALDTRPGQDVEACLAAFTSEGGLAEEERSEVKDYLRFLVTGAWSRHLESDALMLRVVTGWRPERMVSVDRAVLRLAIFEGFLDRSVPFAVAISEAVEIARSFGTEESGRFVNGVLARVVRHVGASGEGEEKKDDAPEDP